jgi:hypothetical protein
MINRVNGSNTSIAEAKPNIEKPMTTVGTNFGDRNSISIVPRPGQGPSEST